MAIQMTLSLARISSNESFSVIFSLSEVSNTEHFVARQEELNVMYETLSEGSGR